MNYKLKVIFLGTPHYLDPIINSLSEHFDLVKIIRKTNDLNNETIEQFNNLNPDVIVVASFGKIIPNEILEIPRLGAINIHPSRLPQYRGPSPIQSQILDGVTDSAISFILMDNKMDHGPIIYQEPYEIKPEDTFESLLISMFGKSADILPTLIQSLNDNKLNPITQNEEQATFCKEIKKEDGYFDIENPPSPETLSKMIRAYHPWPGTWTRWNNKIVKLLPGNVIANEVKQSQTPYLIQMEGKSPTDIKSFLNGYQDFPYHKLLPEAQ